jgi:CheY-like chemotaxis protein
VSDRVRILVVEDEELVRDLATELLAELGYDVVAAEDGAAALRVLDAGPPPRVLFTDVAMPGGMDGLELAREAKRRQPELKVVYTTGYSSLFASDATGELHGPVLPKPYTPARLQSQIEKVIAEG